MTFYKHKNMFLALALIIIYCDKLFSRVENELPVFKEELIIVGGGISRGIGSI